MFLLLLRKSVVNTIKTKKLNFCNNYYKTDQPLNQMYFLTMNNSF